jgi:hypothetical protein
MRKTTGASSGNIGVGTTTATSLTTSMLSDNLIFNNYTFKGTKVQPSTFNIIFSWENRDVTISLKEGNDVFKLADAFTKWLDDNDIKYDIKTKGGRK